MPRAEILLEDNDGQPGAALRFVFPDGFDVTSPAHQMCNIIRHNLDMMAQAGTLTALDAEAREGDTAGLVDTPNAQPAVNS